MNARRSQARHAASPAPGSLPDDDRARPSFRVGDALRQRVLPGGRRRGQETLPEPGPPGDADDEQENAGYTGYYERPVPSAAPGADPGPGPAGPGPGYSSAAEFGHGPDAEFGHGPGAEFGHGAGAELGRGPDYHRGLEFGRGTEAGRRAGYDGDRGYDRDPEYDLDVEYDRHPGYDRRPGYDRGPGDDRRPDVDRNPEFGHNPEFRRDAEVGRSHGAQTTAETRESWLRRGQMQFDYLVGQGLQPGDRMLEIGCGSLSAGHLFIDYLSTGNYYGVDISPDELLAAQRTITEFRLQDKMPHLTLVPPLDLKFLPASRFTVIHAHNVFARTPVEMIGGYLVQVRRVMSTDAIFDFTFDRAAGSEHQARRPEFHYHRADTLIGLAGSRGLNAELMEDWDELGHPHAKMRLTRRN